MPWVCRAHGKGLHGKGQKRGGLRRNPLRAHCSSREGAQGGGEELHIFIKEITVYSGEGRGRGGE